MLMGKMASTKKPVVTDAVDVSDTRLALTVNLVNDSTLH